MALSKEEKKAKKEAKRLEKLRLEAEAKKKLRRDELQREMTMQALKRSELEKTWREMMIRIKEPVFRQDIEVMWHTFERTYDKKDHLIYYTMKLINVADDQFQRTIASFCDTIDTMINKFLAELDDLSKENDRRTAALLKLGEDDANQIMSDHNAAETHLQLLLFAARTNANNLAWNTRGENMVKEDEERTKYADIREDLRSFLENTYNTMWDEYKAVLRGYVIGTAENQKHVRRLRRKQNVMADIIASQGKKIANSDGLLKRLRTDLAAYESGSKQAVFRDRRNRHRAAWFQLKQRLIEGCAKDKKQLRRLVKASDDACEWMEAAHKKSEKILRMAALCRKFETRREKVLPYDSTEPQEPAQMPNVRRQQSDDSLISHALASTSGLARLWQRIAKAELGKRALYREKMILEHENAIIKQKIQQFNGGGGQMTGPDTKQCMCNIPKKNTADIIRPVAVDGALELGKYGKQW